MERKCINFPFLVLRITSKVVHERIKEEITKSKLNITEFSVLEVFYQRGKQTIQQIRKNILISSSSMTYIIDSLEQRGLLSRNTWREDRRVIHITLTETGNELTQKTMPKHHEVIDNMFDSLSPDESETLVSSFKKGKE
ncbi:MarR family transcriptional regulator [Bacillus atrophaeus]|uniref:MarR family winged helix-turn-helix transcriptional regulator n=1 Tax=Bacillus atrophaeus TaxID=1452 RepID=UPI0022812E29|nr:MarR family transcriptional regulator [Bacillus atrophaeus]MCY8916244.1 MarR family transcriptional regulator [Bacillus atrophaeus]